MNMKVTQVGEAAYFVASDWNQTIANGGYTNEVVSDRDDAGVSQDDEATVEELPEGDWS